MLINVWICEYVHDVDVIYVNSILLYLVFNGPVIFWYTPLAPRGHISLVFATLSIIGPFCYNVFIIWYAFGVKIQDVEIFKYADDNTIMCVDV